MDTDRPTDETFKTRLTLRRVYLDNGGYTSDGTYFGRGAPVYRCASEDGAIDRMFRASCREDAIDKMRKIYPDAKFYGEPKNKEKA